VYLALIETVVLIQELVELLPAGICFKDFFLSHLRPELEVSQFLTAILGWHGLIRVRKHIGYVTNEMIWVARVVHNCDVTVLFKHFDLCARCIEQFSTAITVLIVVFLEELVNCLPLLEHL
jgi:hypothetical protein